MRKQLQNEGEMQEESIEGYLPKDFTSKHIVSHGTALTRTQTPYVKKLKQK